MKANSSPIHPATITPLLLGASILLAVGALAPATAQSSARRFIQPTKATHHRIGGFRSDQYNNSRVQAYDNFAFPKAQTVTGFQWNGVFRSGNTLPPHPMPAADEGSWTVEIHADNGGSPGTRLHREVHSASDVERTQLGTVDGFRDHRDIPWHTFELEFATPFTAAADTIYWVSTFYHKTSNDYNFSWIGGAAASPLGHFEQMSQAAGGKTGYPAFGVILRDQAGAEAYYPVSRLAMSFMTRPVDDDDLDRDGMDDDWEVAHGLDPARDDSSEDLDLDGSTNFREYAHHSDPRDPDTDSDGLPDGAESATGIYVDRSDTGTSPIHPDTDHDGMTDALEDPGLPSQGPSQPGTDPNERDTDRDGYADLLELGQGWIPSTPPAPPPPAFSARDPRLFSATTSPTRKGTGSPAARPPPPDSSPFGKRSTAPRSGRSQTSSMTNAAPWKPHGAPPFHVGQQDPASLVFSVWMSPLIGRSR